MTRERAVPPKLKKINKRTQHFSAPGEDDKIHYAAVFGASRAGEFDPTAATTAPPVEDASLISKPVTATEPTASSDEQRPRDLGTGIREGGDDDNVTMIELITPKKEAPVPGPTVQGDSEAEPDSEDEPDTEDDEPAAEDENELASAGEIADELARAQLLVITSFSWGSYGLAEEAIRRARRAAEKVRPELRVIHAPGAALLILLLPRQFGASAAYNAGLRSVVEALRPLQRKRDFLGRMQKAGLGLLVGSGVTDADAAEFLAALP